MRLRPLLLAWIALLLLLGATIGASLLPIGGWRQFANLMIAGIKAAIIVAVFMKLGRDSGLVRLAFAVSGILLVVLAGLLTADYQLRPKADPVLSAEVAMPR